MPLTIHLVRFEQLRSIDAGSTQVDGFRVMPGSLPASYLIKSAIENLKQRADPMWYSFFLFIHPDGRHAIGSGNFHGQPVNNRAEIGYEIAPPFRRKGYATQAVLCLVDLAFQQPSVTEVYAESSVDNIASGRVLEKAGFRHVGKHQLGGYGLVDRWLIIRETSTPEAAPEPSPENQTQSDHAAKL